MLVVLLHRHVHVHVYVIMYYLPWPFLMVHAHVTGVFYEQNNFYFGIDHSNIVLCSCILPL